MKSSHHGFQFRQGTYEGVVRSAKYTLNHNKTAKVLKVEFIIPAGFKKPMPVNRTFYADGSVLDEKRKDSADLSTLFQLLTPMNYRRSLEELVGKRVRFDIRHEQLGDGTSYNFVYRFAKSRVWDPSTEVPKPEPVVPQTVPTGWGFHFGKNKPATATT